MTASTHVLGLVIGLSVVSGTLAATVSPPSPPDRAVDMRPEAMAATRPSRWVRDWLMVPLRRAIADATDPRDRKAGAD